MVDSHSENDEISAADAIDLVADGGAWLLDVREDDEWNAGHAADAHHIPLGALGERQSEIPEDRQVLVVCKSGGRSARATQALNGAGYHAVNVAGGSHAWQSAGGAMVTDDGQPGIVL